LLLLLLGVVHSEEHVRLVHRSLERSKHAQGVCVARIAAQAISCKLFQHCRHVR
jgi:hypothetical protein